MVLFNIFAPFRDDTVRPVRRPFAMAAEVGGLLSGESD
jgi:hypothetical protein